ncbi:MAG: hypothetical protein Q9157_005856 [Trypethelium eluteriae]
MQLFAKILSLPPSLLVLIATSSHPIASEKQWPYNLPPHVKYFPEDEVHIKRSVEIQNRLATQVPSVVRKMSPDAGEMFFLDYWQFDDLKAPQSAILDPPDLRGEQFNQNAEGSSQRESLRSKSSIIEDAGNGTGLMLPPFHLHAEISIHQESYLRFLRRTLIERDYQCPAETNDCASIGRPNNCCATDETCVIVTDTGNGDVGCCPSGSSCGSQVSSCNTAAGYTSCPGSPNGGCCIPGFACQDVGCESSTATKTTASSSSPPPPPSTSSVVTAGTPVPVPSPSATITTSTATPISSSATCSTGFQSCPASVGGGCCPTDRACGSPDCPPLPSSTGSSTGATAVPPVRPTSDSTEAASVTSTAPSSSQSFVGCPTGFYACSAYYPGGCCQVGRDCASTSCPTLQSTTAVTGSVATVAAGSGTCANGWFSCAANVGGGCCPSGYNCGASCTAGASGSNNQQVGKMAPNAASAAMLGWSFLISGCAFGLGMLIL